MKRLWVALLALAACNGDVLTLKYHLDGVDPTTVAGVRTTIAPVSPEQFLAPQAAITLDDETTYSVACANGVEACDASALVMVVDHVPKQGVLPSVFTLQFRAGRGSPSRLLVGATAPGVDGSEAGRSLPSETSFGGVTLDVFIRAKSFCGAITCSTSQACCGSTCLDVTSDPKNCGDCGVVCRGGESCVDGKCDCAGGGACGAKQTCCPQPPANGCVDLSSDPTSCGVCNKACASGEECAPSVGGASSCGCGTSGKPCDGGTRCCSDTGSCVDPAIGCTCGSTFCLGDQQCCGNQCASITSDPQNCGGCGRSCPSPTNTATCEAGQCQCGGVACASGVCCGDTCVNDLNSDVNNCGACGHACGLNEACSGGMCQCGMTQGGCLSPQVCCGNACVNTNTDMFNCGRCGGVCTSPGSCVAGQCVNGAACGAQPACAPDQLCCPVAVGQGCVSAGSTTTCGNCMTSCRTGETCALVMPPNNFACECVASTGTATCTSAQTCCSNGCKNLSSNATNCGKCGVKCGLGEVCSGGQCKCGSKLGTVGGGEVCGDKNHYCDGSACIAIDSSHCPIGTATPKTTNCTATMNTVCCAYCPPPGDAIFCGANAAACTAKSCLNTYP